MTFSLNSSRAGKKLAKSSVPIPTGPTAKHFGHGSGFGEDAFVVALVGGDDGVGAEFFLGVEAGDWVFSPPGIRLTLLVP